MRPAAAASIAVANACNPVRGKIVHDDDIARRQFGNENVADIGKERVAVHRAVSAMGVAMPPSRRPAVNLVVFQ